MHPFSFADFALNRTRYTLEPEIERPGKGKGDRLAGIRHIPAFGFDPKLRQVRRVNKDTFGRQIAGLRRSREQLSRSEIDSDAHALFPLTDLTSSPSPMRGRGRP
jgi:hypothetical protein